MSPKHLPIPIWPMSGPGAGADLRIPAPGYATKVALLGVLDWAGRELVVQTSRTKRSTDFIALLETLDRRYGPEPGRFGSSLITGPFIPERQLQPPSPSARTGLGSHGCQSMPPNSTTLRSDGAM